MCCLHLTLWANIEDMQKHKLGGRAAVYTGQSMCSICHQNAKAVENMKSVVDCDRQAFKRFFKNKVGVFIL